VEKVPRHLFVPAPLRYAAYDDHPLPIGEGQTISQPYIVAFMTAALDLKPDDKVLEIGTGSGYQAAVLAELARAVYTIEIVEELGKHARELLEQMGYRNIHVRIGDGYKGWPEEAPFDAIVVTAAPGDIPERLVSQLKEGGRFILPVGKPGGVQELMLGRKVDGRLKTQTLMDVRFVPMVKGK
jgi:protein-L-isoaspartate(D-aspartate) O-methyltransferase